MAGSDMRWMALALHLGRRGLGLTWPNPSVGCVLVKDDRVVGRGTTAPGGRPHAERVALKQAGAAANGATAYVSLEPCAHHGKTSPCAQALIDANVARVVYPIADPDDRVSGKGQDMLTAAGIDVTAGIMAQEAEIAHQGFLTRVRTGRPFLTLKLASSFDGRIATASGESQWITGPHARREVHAMRARHDAVLVGGGTARLDLPSLTVRGVGRWNTPVRVVVSAGLSLPKTGPLAENTAAAPLWLIHGPSASQEDRTFWGTKGADLIEVEEKPDGINLNHALSKLAERGLTRVFCEGGGTLAAGLLAEGCVDELVGFEAGLVLGADGYPSVAVTGVTDLGAAPRFELYDTRQVGPDLLSRWRRVK
ncbi:bifunctional diaminohydroxyphosphoribosylaminopyrimidine deaminase/5-amino-6-(5-phosphoribosylamino)uracil reductase RibD [Litoreibacter roseus]|uniref:Riboflavin biosynthesis protein RibD n=1 Tax=Litoreibacter roseus TaxID=2601869 RepID=A0A6N6JB85_9RHOB|nr:bifunctional diaminohydroxyphosphoribosylaminopyrimidine deaminase/5-amino-6-(5-phosphoribosylamino)uracil reductase RibD [Litoreibacter roseus]GFE63503.1 riboflavin biosynthesis protein RibD [Litoreibacter roseus]